MVRTSLTEMAQRMELQIPLKDCFPTQYSVRSSFLEALELLSECLTLKQMLMVTKMPFGHLFDVAQLQFSTQLIHLLLLRLVRDQPEDEMWFSVEGRLMKFTYDDFKRITAIQDPVE
ncbi:unnamed protein product [Cuscuta epithymum]|uniref:Uncharacterized protein n=1 Tax=Cuscuta epithymum TaxID=186058 RepID=A0AAV0F2D4_9ASTE|nr:unnamed protein product [Cuscuta epithymum]